VDAFLQILRNIGTVRLGAMASVAVGLVAFFIYLTTRLASPNMADEEAPPLDELENQEAEVEDSGVDPRIAEMETPLGARDLDAVYQIPLQVSAALGKSTMQVSNLLKMGRGAVVELDRKVGEAIDIYVNNRLVARGEVVVEDKLGVTMTEFIKSERNQ